MEKITLVVTVKNEEKSINALLTSILSQTYQPDEIVFVDGGSVDRTPKMIEDFFTKNKKLNGRLLHLPGTIAQGRNAGIRSASSSLIVVTDAGCILHKHWLHELFTTLTQADFPEGKKVDVVAGFYYPTGSSSFQKCLGVYTSVMNDQVDTNSFLPSSRSIAFRKSAWEKVGGYPEELATAEDLVFAKKLRISALTVVTNLNAVVYWEQKKSLAAAFKQFFRYAQGDGQALYIRKRTPLLFVRIIGGVCVVYYSIIAQSLEVFVTSLIAYITWSIMKNVRYVPFWQSFLILPLLQLTADLAVPLGMLSGIIKRYV